LVLILRDDQSGLLTVLNLPNRGLVEEIQRPLQHLAVLKSCFSLLHEVTVELLQITVVGEVRTGLVRVPSRISPQLLARQSAAPMGSEDSSSQVREDLPCAFLGEGRISREAEKLPVVAEAIIIFVPQDVSVVDV